jgi:uncharacterized Fe-S cluster protein YjdI
MYAIESFLGFNKEPLVHKDEKESADVIRLLFLVVFGFAYVYSTSSEGNSSPTARVKPITKSQIEFSKGYKHKLKGKHSKRWPTNKSHQQQVHFPDESLYQFVSNIRSSKVKPRKSARRLDLSSKPRASKFMSSEEEKDVFDRNANKQSWKEGTNDFNPNPNVHLFPINMDGNQVKQVRLHKKRGQQLLSPSEVMNPNSAKRRKSKSSKCSAVKSNRKNDHLPYSVRKQEEKADCCETSKNCVSPSSENFIASWQQQQEENVREAVKLIEHQNQMLKLSLLNNQEKVAYIRARNNQLKTYVTERESQLQQKDDLIQSLQMKMMKYEETLGYSARNGADIDARISKIKEEHQKEIVQLKRMWLTSELQSEQRITKLVDELQMEREHEKIFQIMAAGSEGQQDREENQTENVVSHEPGLPLKSGTECVDTLLSDQHLLIDSKGSPTRPAINVNSTLGKHDSELQLLKEQNRELELKLCQSDKTLGEFCQEKQELEYFNKQLLFQLEKEADKDNINMRNTQTQEQAQPGQQVFREERTRIAPKPKRSKMFSLSRLLACRKVDIHRNVNMCEKSQECVNTLESFPELGKF